MNGFGGFPPTAFAFFEDLEADNSRDYWSANRTVWEEQVRGPMLALLAELDDEFGPLRMFRPNRDLRFSRDRSPYRLWAGATSESRAVGGIGHHLRVSAAGLAVGYGAMALARDQLRRFRVALDDEGSGREFEDLLATLARRSLPVTCGIDPPLKRVPPGYPTAHPRAELLRWKGAAVVREQARAGWMHTAEALDRIRDVWRGARPLREWLAAYVGATEEPVRSR
ncbi:MAG: DUF2461 domain-containing protein [Thermoleophilia bacterium]